VKGQAVHHAQEVFDFLAAALVLGHRLQGVLNRPHGCERWAEKAKKILNRRNEPKILLKRKDLHFSGAQNELVFECEKRQSNPKIRPKIDGLWGGRAGVRCQVSGVRLQVPNQDSGFGIQESGVRMKSICLPLPPFRLLLSAFCFLPSTFCLLISAFCVLLTADCLLQLRGVRVGETLAPLHGPTTRCHRRQGKEKLVTLKSERTERGYL
jgi:hypothetical protein